MAGACKECGGSFGLEGVACGTCAPGVEVAPVEVELDVEVSEETAVGEDVEIVDAEEPEPVEA